MGRLASPAPVRMPYAPGTVVAQNDIPRYPNSRLVVQREVGKRAGYESFDSALDAMRGASTGNLPAVAIVELDGRFHGYSLAERQHFIVRGTSLGTPQTPFHLPVASYSNGIDFRDERLSAIVDGSELIYSVQPETGMGV
ncbi:MAG: hypothetical protein JWM90_68 [Thermoleophilia bacterium]|nr:hypothetical protein [Thermoleophilia bacterium]